MQIANNVNPKKNTGYKYNTDFFINYTFNKLITFVLYYLREQYDEQR